MSVEKVAPLFHRSCYWHTWSRVLSQDFNGHYTVEVDLTPVNPHFGQSQWDHGIAPIHIRFHLTPPCQCGFDQWVPRLPNSVRASMLNHLGEELRDRLLHEDFLSKISWEKYKEVCNGGANLDQILLDPEGG